MSLFLLYNRWMPTAERFPSPLVSNPGSEFLPPSLSPLFLKILFFLLSDFIEAVHHVSVSINMSHSSLVCGEAWGTDPHFSWLHERAPVTKSVGSVSEDGTTLIVTMTPFCGHFTCMVSNKLGYSSAIYTAGTSSLFFYMK